jgi:hypothetical protein
MERERENRRATTTTSTTFFATTVETVAFVLFETDESYFAEQAKRVFFYREKER